MSYIRGRFPIFVPMIILIGAGLLGTPSTLEGLAPKWKAVEYQEFFQFSKNSPFP